MEPDIVPLIFDVPMRERYLTGTSVMGISAYKLRARRAGL
jgi:hypothetical protein